VEYPHKRQRLQARCAETENHPSATKLGSNSFGKNTMHQELQLAVRLFVTIINKHRS